MQHFAGSTKYGDLDDVLQKFWTCCYKLNKFAELERVVADCPELKRRGITLQLIVQCYSKLKRFAEAETSMTELYNSKHNERHELLACLTLAECYFEEQLYHKAEMYCRLLTNKLKDDYPDTEFPESSRYLMSRICDAQGDIIQGDAWRSLLPSGYVGPFILFDKSNERMHRTPALE